MKIFLRRCIALLLPMTLFISLHAEAAVPQTDLAPMLQKVMAAIVNVRVQLKPRALETMSPQAQSKNNNNDDNPLEPQGKLMAMGSGVIVNAEKGLVITNAHVISNAAKIIVTLGDGHHYTAKVIGMDKPSDIAVLEIHAKNITAIPIGNSNEMRVGDFVAAIGNPFGLNQTVTSGIVSALGRTQMGIENYENFIQTDASINPGNSGGALINLQGQLIGINTAIIAPGRGSIGIGFAIPSNMVKSVMDQLLKYGNVRRGSMGIFAQDVTPELRRVFNLNDQKGAVITEVKPNTPAPEAGLLAGDVITKINDETIKTASDVINTVGFLRVDSAAKLTVLRNNKSLSLTVNLADPQKREKAEQLHNPFLYGVGFKDFNAYTPTHGQVSGVMVMGVLSDSNAWHSDLRPGDVIISANHQKISHIADLQNIAAAEKNSLLLNILRADGALFLVIDKEES